VADGAGEKAREIAQKWGDDSSFLIEMLQDVQEAYRYLPEEVITELCAHLDVPPSKAYHIGTFYKAFSMKPKGEHIISVCTGTACHVKGAKRLIESFERELNITCGETDSTGKFTLEEVRCLGCCGLAPVVTVDEEVHAEVTVNKIAKILAKYG